MKNKKLPPPLLARKRSAEETWLVDRLMRLGAWHDVEDICAHYGQSIELAVLSDFRWPAVVRARHAIWFMLHAPPHAIGYAELGRMFGVHHTTIMAGVHRHKQRSADEDDIASTGVFVRESDGTRRRVESAEGEPLSSSHMRAQ